MIIIASLLILLAVANLVTKIVEGQENIMKMAPDLIDKFNEKQIVVNLVFNQCSESLASEREETIH